MCTCVDGTFNPAPDTPSPVYPDRLIRPLPKRTLRSRLSTDAADGIYYPPTPPASQIFYGAPGDSEEVVNDSKVYVQQTIEADRNELTPEADSHHGFEAAVELESGDEDRPAVVRRSAGFRGSLSPGSSPHPQGSGSAGKDGLKSSTGPDGYDAFENTNNKKKRKIPTPGNLGGHHSALSPEFASMGLANSNPPAVVTDGMPPGTSYGSEDPASPLSNGISGSGRGRLGRSSTRSNSGRNPLSANAQNAWMNGRTLSRRDGLMSSPGPHGMPTYCFSAFFNAGRVLIYLQVNPHPTKASFPQQSQMPLLFPRHCEVPAMSACWTRRIPHRPRPNSLSRVNQTRPKAWLCSSGPHTITIAHPLLLSPAPLITPGAFLKRRKPVPAWLAKRCQRARSRRFQGTKHLSAARRSAPPAAFMPWLRVNARFNSNTQTSTSHQVWRTSGSASSVNTRASLGALRRL